jgi:hypothetical protein
LTSCSPPLSIVCNDFFLLLFDPSILNYIYLINREIPDSLLLKDDYFYRHSLTIRIFLMGHFLKTLGALGKVVEWNGRVI